MSHKGLMEKKKKQITRTTSSFAFFKNKVTDLPSTSVRTGLCLSFVFPFLPCCTGYTGYNRSSLKKKKKKVVDRSISTYLAKRKKKRKYDRGKEIFKFLIIYYQRIASDWGCVLICDSYTPGFGQSNIGQPSSDLDMELMQPIDENLNLDQLNSFTFDAFMSYNGMKPQ